MKIITPDIYDPQRHSFWFPVAIKTPLVLLAKELRSEVAYDASPLAEDAALQAILHVAKCLSGHIYAVISEADRSPMSQFRSRKGFLPFTSPLRKLERTDLEVPAGDGTSRLGVIIPLAQPLCSGESCSLLNWVNGVIVVSSMTREDVCNMVSGWLSGDVTRPLSFNYDAIAASLVKHSETVVFRHFAADNGRNEALVVVGNQMTVNGDAKIAFDELVV